MRRCKRETPPRAWGRPTQLARTQRLFGNTPTGVGKTRLHLQRERTAQKHPHGRGEDPPAATTLRRPAETPPRAWGRLAVVIDFRAVLGNTPTGVGKTSSLCVMSFVLWKHPHGRGEDRSAASGRALPTETPPRAWGRPTGSDSARLQWRNTPTGVGKTPTDC